MLCVYASDEYTDWKRRRRVLVDTGMLHHPSIIPTFHPPQIMHISRDNLRDVDTWITSAALPTKPANQSVVGSPATRGSFLSKQRTHTDNLLLAATARLRGDSGGSSGSGGSGGSGGSDSGLRDDQPGVPIGAAGGRECQEGHHHHHHHHQEAGAGKIETGCWAGEAGGMDGGGSAWCDTGGDDGEWESGGGDDDGVFLPMDT